MKNREPWGFCDTPEEKCTMNYCDENGCQNRKRNYVKGNSSASDVRVNKKPGPKPKKHVRFHMWVTKEEKEKCEAFYNQLKKDRINNIEVNE